ncbi:MAG: hypothetical protein ACYC8T_26865 [Myxococcaceae bacterium]
MANATLGSASTATYPVAAIEAPLDVEPAASSTGAYANGSSTQLAGRGLYGSYALSLPASVLAADEADPASPGLRVNALDVVLLRLDDVSVAR